MVTVRSARRPFGGHVSLLGAVAKPGTTARTIRPPSRGRFLSGNREATSHNGEVMTLGQVREFVSTLPEATERAAWGMPCFRVRDKIFASYREERNALAIRVTPEDKTALPQQFPEVYSVPRHYRNASMLVASLDAIEPDELRELLTDAWRLRAPKRLLAEFDM
jgi:hypothetical protein